MEEKGVGSSEVVAVAVGALIAVVEEVEFFDMIVSCMIMIIEGGGIGGEGSE